MCVRPAVMRFLMAKLDDQISSSLPWWTHAQTQHVLTGFNPRGISLEAHPRSLVDRRALSDIPLPPQQRLAAADDAPHPAASTQLTCCAKVDNFTACSQLEMKSQSALMKIFLGLTSKAQQLLFQIYTALLYPCGSTLIYVIH